MRDVSVTAASRLVERDGVLRAVGHGEAGLVLELGRHLAVADDDGLAVVVDVEELGRQRVAAVVALALLGVHPHLHEPDGTSLAERSGQPDVTFPYRSAVAGFLPIETPRLVLRTFAPQDATALAAYRSDPDVARYQSWAAPYSEEAASGLIAARRCSTGRPAASGSRSPSTTRGHSPATSPSG